MNELCQQFNHSSNFIFTNKYFFPTQALHHVALHTDLRGARAALKVSEGLLWGQKVIILVLKIIELQIACSIHPQQLVSCGQSFKKINK